MGISSPKQIIHLSVDVPEFLLSLPIEISDESDVVESDLGNVDCII
jgi:hypothetical protein